MLSPKRLHTFHTLAMYLSVVLSFLVVASHGPGILLLAIFAISIPLSWFTFSKQWNEVIPNQVWNVFILIVIAWTGLQIYTSDDSIIHHGVRFIVMLLLIKLYSRKGARDDWQIYALSFLLMSAGTAVNEDITYGLIFGLYVVVGTFGLSLFHLTNEISITKITINKTPLSKLYMSVLGVLALMVFASSVTIFFVFPRVGLGFFATKTRQSSSMVGFNDQVQLGGHGVIRDNPTVAMRVEFESGKPPLGYQGFHWRIMAFDQYTGSGWKRSNKGNVVRASYLKGIGNYSISKNLKPKLYNHLKARNKTRPKMQIYLEPLGTAQIPILWPATQIQLGVPSLRIPFDPNHGRIELNTFQEVLFLRRNQLAVLYEMTVHDEPDSQMLAQANEPVDPKLSPSYLALPDNLQRLEKLARDITKTAKTPYEKATRILLYLETNYKYTTNLPKVDGNNPIESFLFETKRGHCEYYATAMALMLRAVGVPSRLVNGFLGGQWYDGYLAVRQGDAHSWVEVYIEPYGWVTFDPTPSGADGAGSKETALQKWFNRNYDSARFAWNKWVLEYDINSQFTMLKNISKALSPRSSFQGGSSNDKDDKKDGKSQQLPIRMIVLFGGFIFICLSAWRTQRLIHARPIWMQVTAATIWSGVGTGWLLWFIGPEPMTYVIGPLAPAMGSLLAHFKRPEHQANARAQSHLLFIQLEKIAKKTARIERLDDEGPSTFIDRIGETYPDLSTDLTRFKQRYLAARFGDRPLTPQEQRALQQLLKRVQQQLKAHLQNR